MELLGSCAADLGLLGAHGFEDVFVIVSPEEELSAFSSLCVGFLLQQGKIFTNIK